MIWYKAGLCKRAEAALRNYTECFNSKISELSRELDKLTKWKILRDCIDSKQHKPIYFVRCDSGKSFRISSELGLKSEMVNVYVFMCKNCRQEYSIFEPQLSKEQRAILVAMGILKKKGVK
jgi:nicotinic acid phosphoribosyltransferase